ncbi:hypothetical protein PsorP6_015225 [Peronosclerospora sorghi]|uniref:Uncharacterized protein n=1 Tax=Peronosclerospora sorghi TaxID=230839 RepID=A0ACC0VSF8_9STRA|nr:hypothetical protein PsorP6_015225 [Peronosclerospora sorghi]
MRRNNLSLRKTTNLPMLTDNELMNGAVSYISPQSLMDGRRSTRKNPAATPSSLVLGRLTGFQSMRITAGLQVIHLLVEVCVDVRGIEVDLVDNIDRRTTHYSIILMELMLATVAYDSKKSTQIIAGTQCHQSCFVSIIRLFGPYPFAADSLHSWLTLDECLRLAAFVCLEFVVDGFASIFQQTGLKRLVQITSSNG